MAFDRQARTAVAGPIALLGSMLCIAIGIALSDVAAAWVAVPVIALAPVAIAVWLCEGHSVAVRALAGVVNGVIGAGVVLAAIAALRFTALTAVVLYALLWVPGLVVLAGSLVVRRRSDAPLLGIWLVWWAIVAAALVGIEPLGLAVTELAGVDGLAAIAMFLAPVLGMAAWAGGAAIAALAERRAGGVRSAPTG